MMPAQAVRGWVWGEKGWGGGRKVRENKMGKERIK